MAWGARESELKGYYFSLLGKLILGWFLPLTRNKTVPDLRLKMLIVRSQWTVTIDNLPVEWLDVKSHCWEYISTVILFDNVFGTA